MNFKTRYVLIKKALYAVGYDSFITEIRGNGNGQLNSGVSFIANFTSL